MSRGLDRDDDARDYYSERVRQARQAAEDVRRQLERDPPEEKHEARAPDFEIHRLPSRTPATEREPDRRSGLERRREVQHRDRTYRLRDSEIRTLTEVGRFRTMDTADLQNQGYNGDRRRASADLDSLRDQGLVETHRIRSANGDRLDVVVLSEEGRDLADRFDHAPEQRHYSGLVKPREVEHDAAIYRMFLAEAERIRADGGEVTRVVLDHELKAKVFGALEKKRQEGPDGDDFEQFQAQTASANGLQAVDGKIPLPDLQIEFRTADGDLSRVNLELTTENYKGSQIAAKANAGFKLYALGDSSGGGSPVRDEREVTADILSL